MKPENIEQKLLDTGYRGLFAGGKASIANQIWNDGKGESALRQLIRSNFTHWEARLMANEILSYHGDTAEASTYALLAKSYAKALGLTSTKTKSGTYIGNDWGFPCARISPGPLGKSLIQLGEAGKTALYSLLDSEEDGIVFIGSQAATQGNSLNLRIKDIAACYIGQMMNTELKLEGDTKSRDKQIEKMKLD